MKRRSLAAWLSSFTFCCCCVFPTPERPPQAPLNPEQQAAKEETDRLAAENRAKEKERRAKEAEERRAKAAAEAEARKSKVTRANYNKINEGMTYDEVIAILGDGKQGIRSGAISNYTWENRDNPFRLVIISIAFQNARVKALSIVD